MREFLAQSLSQFEKSDVVPPGEDLKEALIVFFSWVIPTFLFVFWANRFYPGVEFYQAAINEGIGPNLWNAIGSFGLFSFGVAVMFSQFSTPALVARQILSNTYAIGCLSFGLLLGQWCVLLSTDGLTWWQRGLFGITSGFLLVVVFMLNLVVWYLSFLIKNEMGRKSRFLVRLEHIHWVWKLTIGLCVMLLITLIFLSEI